MLFLPISIYIYTALETRAGEMGSEEKEVGQGGGKKQGGEEQGHHHQEGKEEQQHPNPRGRTTAS